jgi:hypothetical protein
MSNPRTCADVARIQICHTLPEQIHLGEQPKEPNGDDELIEMLSCRDVININWIVYHWLSISRFDIPSTLGNKCFHQH